MSHFQPGLSSSTSHEQYKVFQAIKPIDGECSVQDCVMCMKHTANNAAKKQAK